MKILKLIITLGLLYGSKRQKKTEKVANNVSLHHLCYGQIFIKDLKDKIGRFTDSNQAELQENIFTMVNIMYKRTPNLFGNILFSIGIKSKMCRSHIIIINDFLLKLILSGNGENDHTINKTKILLGEFFEKIIRNLKKFSTYLMTIKPESRAYFFKKFFKGLENNQFNDGTSEPEEWIGISEIICCFASQSPIFNLFKDFLSSDYKIKHLNFEKIENCPFVSFLDSCCSLCEDALNILKYKSPEISLNRA